MTAEPTENVGPDDGFLRSPEPPPAADPADTPDEETPTPRKGVKAK